MQEEPKNPKPTVKKNQYPLESQEHLPPEKQVQKVPDVPGWAPEPRQTWWRRMWCPSGGTRRSPWDLHGEHPQRPEDQGSSTHELPVEVNHPQELLQGRVVGGWQESREGGDVLVERRRS